MWQPPTFFFLLTSLQCFQNIWLLKYFIKLVLIKTYLAQLKTIRNMYLMAIVSPILASGMHKKLCRFLHPLLYISHRICISTLKSSQFQTTFIFFFSTPSNFILLIRHCVIPVCLLWTHIFILLLLLKYKLIENKKTILLISLVPECLVPWRCLLLSRQHCKLRCRIRVSQSHSCVFWIFFILLMGNLFLCVKF